MLRWLALLAVAFAMFADVAAAASPPSRSIQASNARPQRVALVIGNARYAASPLANPVNDARAMAAALKSMGFRVTLVEDATIAQMIAAVRRFGDALQAGHVGLFFYAGHGVQIKGRNYLIPVGVDIQREEEVSFSALDVGQVLERMESAKNGVNIVILDACRNNPFARSFRTSAQGLATMDAPSGSYVAMATAPGRVASDGTDGNGLYTKHLLSSMRTPGIPIEEVFKRTRVKVMAATENQQVPWDYSSLAGDFYFVPAEAATSAASSKAASTKADLSKGDPKPQDRRPAETLQLAKTLPFSTTPPAAAVRVDATESYELGRRVKTGQKPHQQDLPRALALFVEAGERGHPGAQFEAAQMYAQGIGTAKSCTDALAWAQRAAGGGSAEAAMLAGDLNRADCGGSRNPVESARWYRVAADKGNAAAQVALGLLYMNGEGVGKDLGEAKRWLGAAMAQGNPSAKFYLERLPR